METLPSWGKSFHIEADIAVKKLPSNGYANIFRFTKGGKKFREYGTRIPALWIHGWKAQNRGFFHLQSGTNDDTFHVFNSVDFESFSVCDIGNFRSSSMILFSRF